MSRLTHRWLLSQAQVAIGAKEDHFTVQTRNRIHNHDPIAFHFFDLPVIEVKAFLPSKLDTQGKKAGFYRKRCVSHSHEAAQVQSFRVARQLLWTVQYSKNIYF